MRKNARLYLVSLLIISISYLAACGGLTPAPTPAAYVVPPPIAHVNDLFEQSVQGHIAYNAPDSMRLDETVDVQLLLSPIISAEELKSQIVGRGEILEGDINITPVMKAELKSGNPQDFTIQALHDSPDLVVLTDAPTEWRWSVTAKQAGDHTLTLTLYRQVEFHGQYYWPIVQTYQTHIRITVTAAQWLQTFDWKWLAGILLTAILIPAMWRIIDINLKKKAALRKRSH